MRRALLVTLVVTSGILAGCYAASDPLDASVVYVQPGPPRPAEQVAVAPAGEIPPTKPDGCKRGGKAAREAASARHTLATSTPRDYLVYTPSGPASDVRLPLVLNFHGRGSDAATQERYSGLVPVAERVGFYLVSPEGTGAPRGWSAGATPPGEVDDVAFVRELVGTLEATLCIDPARIYATGFSNGAFMASRLGCVMGDRIAAFAAVAGMEHSGEQCAAPVPALAIHGTNDAIVPFNPGMVRQWFPYAGARGEATLWAKQNGCGSAPSVEKISTNVTRETYPGGKASVVLYVIQGGGHTWPGASDIPGLGPTSREVSAAETIWAFFANHPKAV